MEILSAINLVIFYLPEKFCYFLSQNGIEYSPKSGYYLCVLSLGVALFLITRYTLGRTASNARSIRAHQKLVKSKVAWLNFVFVCVLVLIFWLSYAIFFDFLYLKLDDSSLTNQRLNLALPFLLSMLLVCVILFSYLKKRYLDETDISSLAKMLGATEIHPNTTKNSEKILLNIVEEMAIAARMQMPRVFVMKNENGVNAMASGENFGENDEKIAIFVTAGAMKTFNRDEMQGVIGHEFSHAFHNDIELNIKLISVIGALGVLSFIGYKILDVFRGSSRSSSRNGGGGIAIIILVGLVFMVLGFLGKIFAELIQSAISRQKEYLADASSVQYTRNPYGLKKALDKLFMIQKFNKIYSDGIGKDDYAKDDKNENEEWLDEHFGKQPRQNGASGTINVTQEQNFISNSFGNIKNFKINNKSAKQCAHMFFLPGFSGLFATHPSLNDRIKKLKQIGGMG